MELWPERKVHGVLLETAEPSTVRRRHFYVGTCLTGHDHFFVYPFLRFLSLHGVSRQGYSFLFYQIR